MNLIKCKLIRKKSSDGYIEMLSHVEIGSVYEVDLDSKTNSKLYNTEQNKYHYKVLVWDKDGANWLPWEFLEEIRDEV